MRDEVLERVQLEDELRLALARRELEVHYQPQVALADGRIAGVEALMRWRHRDRGWIPPARFIPVAESTNLSHPLGELALARSFRQIREWDRAGLPPLRVAVNVSARQFRSAGFVRTVETALRVAALDPGQVELELGEPAVLESREHAPVILGKLKAIGLQIAIDDCGAGRSDLGYISRLPVDCLKIDRSLVQRVTEDERDAVIVRAVIAQARTCGMRTVAEGLETVEQLDLVLSLGCDEAQGELFCRPLPAGELGRLLAAGAVPMP